MAAKKRALVAPKQVITAAPTERPRHVRLVPCTLPGYGGARMNICVSHSRRDLEVREDALQAQADAFAADRARASALRTLRRRGQSVEEATAYLDTVDGQAALDALIAQERQSLQTVIAILMSFESWQSWPFPDPAPTADDLASWDVVPLDLLAWFADPSNFEAVDPNSKRG